MIKKGCADIRITGTGGQGGQVVQTNPPVIQTNPPVIIVTNPPVVVTNPPVINTGNVALYGQCGGQNWNGATNCGSGAKCVFQNPWYSQCLP